MTFVLFAFAAILWSLVVLRWSFSRRRAGTVAIVVSIAAAALATASLVDDWRAIIARASARDSGVTITVNDMGAWWQIAYQRGPRAFITANEIHVPAGALVHIEWNGPRMVTWASRDFLAHDLRRFTFVANDAGVNDVDVFQVRPLLLRHIQIFADSPADFDRWFASQCMPARGGAAAQQLVENAGCAYCHVIRGVAESPWKIAPDLTHFASRHTIAATGLPNRRGNLAGWIVHSTAIKRESLMPENNVNAATLRQLLTYLESLR